MVTKYHIAETEKYIYICLTAVNDEPLSWEEIQKIKDKHFPNLDFVETYPKEISIINNANERHLWHYKDKREVPYLFELETKGDINFYKV